MSVIAYLVSEYPAASHTFIRREIAALRARGLTILPFSIRRPGLRPEDECGRIEHVLGRSPLAYLGAMLSTLVRNPGRFLATWLLACRHRPAGLRGLMWAQFHFVEAMMLAVLLRKSGAVRLHNHFANSGATVGMLSAHYLDLLWSLTLHGISETDHPVGALLPEKLARADFVACASWFMRAQAMRMSPPDLWPKFVVVRCGVDLGALPAPHAETGDGTHGMRFICVGRLSPEKGYSGLLEAFAALLREGVPAHLTIVGDGPMRSLIEQDICGRGLGDAVRMTGALAEQDTLAQIAAADVLVLPSLMEGLPVVLMEAMALGKPVIASSVAGIPELVRNGITGLLFRPSDWQHLTIQMSALAKDAAWRGRLAKAGREAIDAEYAIDVAIEPLVARFQNVKQLCGAKNASQHAGIPDD